MTVGTLVKWLKQEGDAVESGDIVAEVETDKATMEVENFFDGVILKHYVEEGGQVPISTPICAVGEKGETPPEVDKPEASKAPEAAKGKEDTVSQKDTASAAEEKKTGSTPAAQADGSATQPDTPSVATAQPATATNASGEKIKSSPLARKIAAEKGISLESIQGTGPGGRIVKQDVLDAEAKGVKTTTAAPAQSGSAVTGLQEKSVPLSGMRRAIATRLLESKTQIPHFYLDTEVDMAALLKLRTELNAHLANMPPEQGGIKLTVNDLLLKASTQALCKVPAANASWSGDAIQWHGHVHIAFGVAVEEGLVTPVIRNAETKGLQQISIEAKALIAKARSKKLTPDEMSGSTFTVTNLGMYGITRFYGIINPPNAAILSVGSTVKKPVVDANDTIVVGQRMTLGLSCDHRVIDGAIGAEYLAALKNVIETPSLMLLG